MNEDYRDILAALVGEQVRFLVVGACAGSAREGVRVPVLGLDDLMTNKQASGRDKDRADVKGLEGQS